MLMGIMDIVQSSCSVSMMVANRSEAQEMVATNCSKLDIEV